MSFNSAGSLGLSRAQKLALYILMAVLAIPFLAPTWWMISSSLMPIRDIFSSPPKLWPSNPQWGNYGQVFSQQPFARQYFNSVYIGVAVTVGTLVVSSLAGYGFARVKFRGQNALFLLVLCGLLIPSEVTIVPLFMMVGRLGLINTHWPLIIIPVFGAPGVLGTFIMRQFFLGIPKELEEAGRVDGLGWFGLFWRIVLPLARPALGAVAIFTFLRSWDSYLEPLVYLSDKPLYTLPLALTQYTDAYGGHLWNVQLAATALTVIPVLIVFIIAQRQFVEGLAHTGSKG